MKISFGKKENSRSGESISRSASADRGFIELYKKELTDHLTSKRFYLIFALLFFVSVVSVVTAVPIITESLTQNSANGRFVFLQLFTTGSGTIYSFATFISFLGPLIGIALGFDAINNERAQGTLNRLVSQPIYRDSIINAKFLASATVILLIILFLGMCVAGYGLLAVGVPPSGEEILRALAFLLLSVVYVSFWLALSTVFSVVCRHAATGAIAGIALWLFFSMFMGLIAKGAADAVYSRTGDQREYYTVYLAVSRISPYYLFTEAATTIMDPTIRSIGIVTNEQMMNVIATPLDFQQSVLLIWPHMVVMAALAIVSFAVAYVKFMRQEIRA